MNYSKIDKLLLSQVSISSENEKVDCIVKAFDFPRLKKYLLHNKCQVLDEYLFINSFKLRLTKKQILSLSSLSQVSFIYSLSKATTLMNVAKKIFELDGLSLSGRGVNVAFIDTGIAPHPDFLLEEDRVIYFKDFVGGKEKIYDDNGHGTFVSGVCAGNGCLSGGKYCGIAPQAKIISLKALNGKGEASADKIIDAMQWVYNNHKQYDIKVVCMSFGSEPVGFNDPIMAGSEALWREGIVVVAAAGNSGPEFQTIKSPGVSGRIITVGGFDDNRIDSDNFDPNFFEIADFSSRGPAFQRFKPDLVAPSVDITSCGVKGDYVKLSGTSVATPMIAGVVALLLEKEGSLSPDQVKQKLLSCCKAITFNKNSEGFGYPVIKEILGERKRAYNTNSKNKLFRKY